jgi:hypothetical protein
MVQGLGTQTFASQISVASQPALSVHPWDTPVSTTEASAPGTSSPQARPTVPRNMRRGAKWRAFFTGAFEPEATSGSSGQ